MGSKKERTMTARETADYDALRAVKDSLRVQAKSNRQRQEKNEELSRQICETTILLAEFRAAKNVLAYVAQPSEVQTASLLTTAWNQQKRVVVPCCRDGELELFWIESVDELAPGTLGILEPRAEIRQSPERQVAIREVDLVVVPGVAFDRSGGRLGFGKGYYDKLLGRTRRGITLVGLAFECQLFDEVPMLPHDVFMDKVVTEKTVYEREREGNRG
jgi:5-formyltetrahydrofolate cyclo-ligase